MRGGMAGVWRGGRGRRLTSAVLLLTPYACFAATHIETEQPSSAPLGAYAVREQPVTWETASEEEPVLVTQGGCSDFVTARHCWSGWTACFRDVTDQEFGWGHEARAAPVLGYCCTTETTFCCGLSQQGSACCDREHEVCTKDCHKDPEDPGAFSCKSRAQLPPPLNHSARDERQWKHVQALSGTPSCSPSSTAELMDLHPRLAPTDQVLKWGVGDLSNCFGKCCRPDPIGAYLQPDSQATPSGMHCCANCCGGVCAPIDASCCYAPHSVLPQGVSKSAFCTPDAPVCCAAPASAKNRLLCCSEGSDCCASCGGLEAPRCCGCSCCEASAVCKAGQCVDKQATLRATNNFLWVLSAVGWALYLLGTACRALLPGRLGARSTGYQEVPERHFCQECGAEAHCMRPHREQNWSSSCRSCARLNCTRADCHGDRVCDMRRCSTRETHTGAGRRETVHFETVHLVCPCKACQCSRCMPWVDCRRCTCEACTEHDRFLYCPFAAAALNSLALLVLAVYLREVSQHPAWDDNARVLGAANLALPTVALVVWHAFFRPNRCLPPVEQPL
eukprot:Hpha_TRINITY_DN8849_c0_g1::TRINITY_DN8849_c0_g1_i1::g.141415::m.141415